MSQWEGRALKRAACAFKVSLACAVFLQRLFNTFFGRALFSISIALYIADLEMELTYVTGVRKPLQYRNPFWRIMAAMLGGGSARMIFRTKRKLIKLFEVLPHIHL